MASEKKKAVISFVLALLAPLSALAAAFGYPLPDLQWLELILNGSSAIGVLGLAAAQPLTK